ncbi:Aspartic peptidase domain containing protein [Lactarius tabidus]
MRFLVLIAALPFILSVLGRPGKHSPRLAGVAIPLSKRNNGFTEDGVVNSTHLMASVKRSSMKFMRGLSNYARNTDTGLSLNSRSSLDTVAEPLVSFNDEAWFGILQIGDPPQNSQEVVFDTGSSDLFIKSISCNGTFCNGNTPYNPNTSKAAVDLNKSFELKYGSGDNITGEQYTDTFSIAGLTACNQTYGAASTYTSGLNDTNFPLDGLVGMAYQSISHYNASPLFQTLFTQGQLTHPQFGIKLAESGAECHLGGPNPDLYEGDFTYLEVINQSYWQVAMDTVMVGDTAVQLSDNRAIMDTGTTLIVGNKSDVEALYALIPGAKPYDPEEGLFTMPCNTSIAVSLVFSNKEFLIPPNLFNYAQIDNSTCVGAFAYDPFLLEVNITYWIVGDQFLRGYYSLFDFAQNRVGLAALK